MDPPEVWCLAIADGKECKEAFESYSDFEEHFCQHHLDISLFACGGEGCTAQFATPYEMFRHLEICKRKGKKVKLPSYPEDIMARLATLEEAKLLTLRCWHLRGGRGRINAKEEPVGAPNAVNDEQLHVPLTEESVHVDHFERGGPGPSQQRRERAVTPARQAAWRMKEQMLLEEEVRKKNAVKEPQKKAEHVEKKQKKLPVKITSKTRFSALITDNPETSKVPANKPQNAESDKYGDNSPGNVNLSPRKNSKNSAVAPSLVATEIREKSFRKRPLDNFQKGVHCTEGVRAVNSSTSLLVAHRTSSGSRPALPINRSHDGMPTVQEKPRVFKSSLPTGPKDSPKTVVAPCQRSSSVGPVDSRPPDYSDFLRHPVMNPVLRETAPHQQSAHTFPSPQKSFAGSQVDQENGTTTSYTTASTNDTIQLATEADGLRNDGCANLRGILRKKAVENNESSISSQRDLSLLSIFMSGSKESKLQNRLFERPKVVELPSEFSEKEAAPVTANRVQPVKQMELSTTSATIQADLPENSERNVEVVSSNEDEHEGKMDEEDEEGAPTYINIFTSKETPTLYDPRIKPEEKPSAVDESRSGEHRSNAAKGSAEMSDDSHCRYHGSSSSGKERKHHYHHCYSSHKRSRSRSHRHRLQRRSRSRSLSWSKDRSWSRSAHRSSSRRSSQNSTVSRSRSGSRCS